MTTGEINEEVLLDEAFASTTLDLQLVEAVVVQREAVDVPQPTPLADLQAQERAPTPEATIHRTEVVGLPGLHEDGDRDLEGWQNSEWSQVQGIICSYPWPQGCGYWIAIAFCESSLRPSALGFGGYYVGLFQVWTGHGYEYDRLLEPLYNTQAAWELSYEGIYTRPWPRCQWQ